MGYVVKDLPMKRCTFKVVGCAAGLLLLALIVPLFAPPLWAIPDRPGRIDRDVALGVTLLLEKQHLSRHPLDEEISERFFKTFLQTLDPMKLFFYQSDIDNFARSQDQIADHVRRGDVSFAYTVFRTFLARIDERIKVVDELLAAPQDFTIDEEMAIDKELMAYARTPAEARERWRKRVKYDILVIKTEKVGGKAAPSDDTTPEQRLVRRYHSYAKQMRQTGGEELLMIYLTSLTSSLDPHTSYMSPDTMDNFEIAMRLRLEGIGASLQSIDGYVLVRMIIPGGAADRDGRLKAGDKIVGVGEGNDGGMIDVVDMKLDEVVKMIRGRPDTTVRLDVMSVGGVRKIIPITRAKIELKDSEAKGEIFAFGRKADGTPFKIGRIDLPSFYADMSGAGKKSSALKSTTRDVRRILGDFNRKRVDAVVLDLRRNGGGSLTEAITLTGLFIENGPVLQVKDAKGRVSPQLDPDPAIVWTGPLIVLESKFSASASEILAGAIQDYRRGLIVGDHATHGKGTVQSLLDLRQYYQLPDAPPMGTLKITTQQFYRPGGASTQKRGVIADVELPSLTTYLDVGEADLSYPFPYEEVAPLKFKNYGCCRPDEVEKLRRLSAARCASSEKFQKAARSITAYKMLKERKYVTLNEAKFVRERTELTADKEKEEILDKMGGPTATVAKPDYYFGEALAVTVDYLNLQRAARMN
jgi:carboxyl-terminal processing protease